MESGLDLLGNRMGPVLPHRATFPRKVDQIYMAFSGI